MGLKCNKLMSQGGYVVKGYKEMFVLIYFNYDIMNQLYQIYQDFHGGNMILRILCGGLSQLKL